MFTGIVKELGVVNSLERNAEGMRISIHSTVLINELFIDDSVSINGVCQTVVDKEEKIFYVQSVWSTLEKTNLSKISIRDLVNLELALRPIDRLGGHFVSGHVDQMLKLREIRNTGKNYVLKFDLPKALKQYCISHGSVCINGVSLTICDLSESSFSTSVIPHTWESTNLKNLRVGSLINFEADIMGKYIEKILLRDNNNKGQVTRDWLFENGF